MGVRGVRQVDVYAGAVHRISSFRLLPRVLYGARQRLVNAVTVMLLRARAIVRRGQMC